MEGEDFFLKRQQQFNKYGDKVRDVCLWIQHRQFPARAVLLGTVRSVSLV